MGFIRLYISSLPKKFFHLVNRLSLAQISCCVCVGSCQSVWVHQCCYSAGELHSGRDPGVDGQKEEHPEYVRDCPCRPWQINSDRLTRVQSRYHRLLPGRRDPLHRHQKRWTRALHYHQVNVCIQWVTVCLVCEVFYFHFLLCILLKVQWLVVAKKILGWASRSNEWLVNHRRFCNAVSDPHKNQC